MGKGFENYMSKKWFHPTNVENMKRVYAAEQKSAAEKKRQQELREQYEREQEFFSSKQLMGDEKARIGLSFMYQAPAGYKEKEKQDESMSTKEAEPKFEWQRKGHAPREENGKNSQNVDTKPASSNASSEARNVKCVKCKRWGHVNTDKSCPLYGKSRLDIDSGEVNEPVDTQLLAKGMESEGLMLKRNLLPMAQKDLDSLSANIKEEKDADDIARGSGGQIKRRTQIKQEEETDEDSDSSSEVEFNLEMLQELSSKDKKFFLKRLNKIKKKMKKNKSSKRRHDSESSSSSSSSESSDSDSDNDKSKKRSKKKKSNKKHKKNH